MKNRIFNIFAVLTIVFMGFTFSACQNEPIFYNIAKEVPLDKGTVLGNVFSLVEQGKNLYTQNGNIFRKGLSADSKWEIVDKPEGNVVRLASSDTYLYALVALNDKGNNLEIYSAPATDGKLKWTKISVTSKVKTIFDNEAPVKTKPEDAEKRIAYYSSYDEKEKKSKLFKLEGTKATEIKDFTIASTKETATYPVKAAWISTGDLTVFSDDMSFASDRKTYFYKTDKKLLKYSSDGKTWKESTPEIKDTSTLAFYNDGSNAYLYTGVGKDNGNDKDDEKKTEKHESMQVLELDANNVPTGKLSTPVGTNEEFKNVEIFGIFPYPQGTGSLYISTTTSSESGNVILSGSKNNRLWGYHKDTNTWNRE